jgi:hypothetical protein
VAVGALKPLTKGVVHHGVPENAEVTRGAETAFLNEGKVGVFLRDVVVVESTEEELVSLGVIGEWPTNVHR